jgi:hypothetical protein
MNAPESKWQKVTSDPFNTYRLKTPDGWVLLVIQGDNLELQYVPDERGSWST